MIDIFKTNKANLRYLVIQKKIPKIVQNDMRNKISYFND